MRGARRVKLAPAMSQIAAAVVVVVAAAVLAGAPCVAAASASAFASASSASTAPKSPVRVADSCVWPGGMDAAVERFSRVLQHKTVSIPSGGSASEFEALNAYLASDEGYGRVLRRLDKVEKVGGDGGLSHLIEWTGRNPSLRPALFVSHTDVVPVPEQSLADWTHPPFGGVVSDGYVWGRGAIDVKVTIVTLLEAAGALLDEGWRPERTLLFAFGHDEEVGGLQGAGRIAGLLRERGVELEVVWDEGSCVLSDGLRPFIRSPVALVSTAEKGFQGVEVSITSAGGHSSMPPVDGSSVGDVAGRILSRLSASPPAPKLVPPVTDLLRGLAPHSPLWLRAVLAAVGRVPGAGALVASLMAASSGEGAALVRTTAVVTRLEAGVADNVMPQQATVLVNARLLPGDTAADIARHLAEHVIGPKDKERVTVRLREARSPPSKVAPADGPWFALLRRAVQDVWRVVDADGDGDGGPVPVLPFLLPGMTDSRHYDALSRHGTLRHGPFAMSRSAGDVRRVHGTDERMAIDSLRGALCVTRRALRLFGERGVDDDDDGSGDDGGVGGREEL